MGFTDPYGNVNNRRCGLIAATVLFLMGAPVSAQRVAVGNYSWNLVDDWMNSVSANVTAPWAPSYMTTYTTFGVLVGNMTTLLYKNSVGLSFDWSKLLFIGSASQWVSAAMIYRAMDLATARDTPNTPISTYLTLAPGLRNVTLRQLVSYTGGIQGSDSCSESGLLTRVGLTTPLAMDACIDSIISSNNVSTAAQLPQGPPGSRYHFNGASMQLAAAVAMSARAARRDSYDHTQWAQLVGVNLRDLLGITPGMVYYMPNNNPSITSGLRMRAEDYGTFLRWYLNGSFMLPGSLFGFYRMEDDHTPDSAGVASAFSPLPADPYASLFHVGAGHWIECRDDRVQCSATTRARGSVSNNGFYPYMDRSLLHWAIIVPGSDAANVPQGNMAGSLALGDVLWPLISTLLAPGRPVTGSPSGTITFTPSVTGTSSNTPSNTGTTTGTPTVSSTASITGSAGATGSPTSSGASTVSGTGTVSATVAASPTGSTSGAGSGSGTPTVTGSATATQTRSPTSTPSPTRSGSGAPTPSSTGSPGASSTATGTGTPSGTPSATGTPTSSPTVSRTSSASLGGTPSPTGTGSASRSPSASLPATASVSGSRGASGSGTGTGSPSGTCTPSATGTGFPSGTPSGTGAVTPTRTRSSTPTGTSAPTRVSFTPTGTRSPSGTGTNASAWRDDGGAAANMALQDAARKTAVGAGVPTSVIGLGLVAALTYYLTKRRQAAAAVRDGKDGGSGAGGGKPKELVVIRSPIAAAKQVRASHARFGATMQQAGSGSPAPSGSFKSVDSFGGGAQSSGGTQYANPLASKRGIGGATASHRSQMSALLR